MRGRDVMRGVGEGEGGWVRDVMRVRGRVRDVRDVMRGGVRDVMRGVGERCNDEGGG